MNYARFIEWLDKELVRRDWTQADFSRKSGLSTATVSNILSQKERPGLRFLEKTIIAFGWRSPEAQEALRQLGLIPPLPTSIEERQRIELLEEFRPLSETKHYQAIEVVRGLRLLEQQQKYEVKSARGESTE